VEFLDPYRPDALDGVDLVHIFGSDWPVQEIATLLTARRVPFVTSSVYLVEGFEQAVNFVLKFVPRTLPKLQEIVFRLAQFILPNSLVEARMVQSHFGVPRGKLRVVPNGVDVSRVGTAPEDFRRRFLPDLPADADFVLQVARVESRKNTLSLIGACERLGVPLVLIGKPYPAGSAYAARVEERVSSSASYVRHIKAFVPQEDLLNAYAAAKVHALLSTMETTGLVTLEAGLHGCNLVVGDCPPVREYFAGLAWLVNGRDVGQVAGALEAALGSSRDTFGQSATIRQRYSWLSVAQQTLDVYRLVVGPASGPRRS